MPHRILPAAQQRLIEIWEYINEKWGEEQADSYIKGFFDELDPVSGKPHRWKKVHVGESGTAYSFRYRHHYVFLRQLSEGSLGIISVLHESMNLPDRILEEYHTNEDE